MLAAAGIAATASPGAATARFEPSFTNGLRGQVLIGPTTPVCRTDIPCEAPARGVTLTFARSGDRVLSVKTDAQGWYRATLPAAIYTVDSGQRRERLFPQNVKVRPGHVDRLDFHIDTGLR